MSPHVSLRPNISPAQTCSWEEVMGSLLEDRKGWNRDISPIQTLSVATRPGTNQRHYSVPRSHEQPRGNGERASLRVQPGEGYRANTRASIALEKKVYSYVDAS